MSPVTRIRLQRILRIVSATLGLGIFILLNVVTWSHVSDELRARTPHKGLLLSLPKSTPQVSTGGDKVHELRQGLVLVHLVLIRDEVPLVGRELRIRWPQDRGRLFVSTGSVDGVSFRFELVPNSVQLGRGTPIYIQGNNQQRLQCGSMQRVSEMASLSAHQVGSETGCDEHLPLSLFPRTTHFYRFETMVHHITPGQPLRKVSVSHYQPRWNARSPHNPLFTRGNRARTGTRDFSHPAHVLTRLAQAGPAMLLAVLLMVFGFFRSRRRLLALPLITAACLACAIFWDYWAVARARAVLTNPRSSVSQQEQAARLVQRSQFFRHSAHRVLQSASRKNKPLRTHDIYDVALARLSGKPHFLQNLFELDVLSLEGTSKTAQVTFQPQGEHAHFTIRVDAEASQVVLRLRTWLRAYHHKPSLIFMEDVFFWDGATLHHKKESNKAVLTGLCKLRVSTKAMGPNQERGALVLKRRAHCGATSAAPLGKDVVVTLRVITGG